MASAASGKGSVTTSASIASTMAPQSSQGIAESMFVILFPLVIIVSLLACKKYQSALHRCHLERLEKLWLINPGANVQDR